MLRGCSNRFYSATATPESEKHGHCRRGIGFSKTASRTAVRYSICVQRKIDRPIMVASEGRSVRNLFPQCNVSFLFVGLLKG